MFGLMVMRNERAQCKCLSMFRPHQYVSESTKSMATAKMVETHFSEIKADNR